MFIFSLIVRDIVEYAWNFYDRNWGSLCTVNTYPFICVVSTLVIGEITGSLFILTRFQRRFGIVITCATSILWWVVIASSYNVMQLLIGRLILGEKFRRRIEANLAIARSSGFHRNREASSKNH